jgi:transposase
MPKPYSDDLRERVIEAVVAGASRREATESFSLSASSAVRWLQRWHDTGNARAKLSGGSRRLRNPSQLRRRERYHQTPPLKGVPFGCR